MTYRAVRHTRSQMDGKYFRDSERRFQTEEEAMSYAEKRSAELATNYIGQTYIAVYAGSRHIASYDVKSGGVLFFDKRAAVTPV